MEPSHVFTDFLACEVCWRDFNLEDQTQQIPFWITSCGHSLCDDHGVDPTNPRCTKCGTEGITTELFGPNLSSEVAAYFSPAADSLETVAGAVKYQQQYLFNLVLFFKDKVVKQKGVLDEVKGRLAAGQESARRVQELEMEVGRLRSKLDQRTNRIGPPSFPGSSVDGDGRKRIRDVGMHSDPTHHRAPSSAGSLHNALPPHRVSIQPSKRNPSAAAAATVSSHVVNGVRDPGPSGGGGRSRGNENGGMDVVRPASGLGQYAYNPNRRASATPVQRSQSDANAFQQQHQQQQQQHQVVQLPPLLPRNPSRLGHHSSAAPIPSRSQATSRASNQATAGGGPSIRAMATPSIQHRPTSVVQSHRHSSYTPIRHQFPPPPHQPQPQHQIHNQPPPPATPRPSTGARMPFYPSGNGVHLGACGQSQGGGGGGGGGGRPSSRMMIEEYDFDDQGFGMPAGGGDGFGASQGSGGAPFGGGGMNGRGYMPR
ncbi:hypothetical protein BDY24DRAFT_398840 [Mrakia frigida]|uniref:SUMO ligase CST9 n=1 Tax=Mrakia frigida TaxID=29902 RepID=UPI003FCBFD8B